MKVLLFASVLASLGTALNAANSDWTMKSVRTIQARVQGDEPVWKNKRYQSEFGKDAAMDTVNTASVEGALMFVQAECINAKVQTKKCKRKNNVKYVVFYDITIVQPTDSVAYHEDRNVKPEYGDFVAMDTGACTKVGTKFPPSCDRFFGLNKEAKLGPYVGGSDKSSDPRALYSNTIWFSFPNSCPTMKWGKGSKTAQCKKEQPGGLCPLGTKPDGKKCTYQYDILGYIKLDDLVGITSMTNESTGETYKNFTEFCAAGLVEFDADDKFENVKSNLTFWDNPTSNEANDNRTQAMIDLYAKVAKKNNKMKPLPKIADLVKKNPKCYENVKKCSTNKFGCKRLLYAQICTECTKEGEKGCEIAPKSFSFPKLVKPVGATDKKEAEEEKKKKDAASGAATNVLGLTSVLGCVLSIFFMTQ